MSKKKSTKLLKQYQLSKKKVSSLWSKYSKEKQKVLSRKRLAPEFKRGLIADLKYDTKENIRLVWERYNENKYQITGKSDIEDAYLTGVRRTENTIQKNYKLTKDYDTSKLDGLCSSLLERENVKGVQVIFKVYDEEQERYFYGSEFITKGQLERLESLNISVYDHVAQKLYYAKSTQDFELKSIHLRVIYAKAKSV
jgi:hypothetical protein